MIGDDMFTLLPLDEIERLTVTAAEWGPNALPPHHEIIDVLPDAREYFVFAEIMISLRLIAVRLKKGDTETPVISTCGSEWTTIANSFDEFWVGYMKDERIVGGCFST